MKTTRPFLLALLALGLTLPAATIGTWSTDGNDQHVIDGDSIIIAGQTTPAKLLKVPVQPGKHYRLHYTAQAEVMPTSQFLNLQFSTNPRTIGQFLIQDVRNAPQPAFQNFQVPADADYQCLDLLLEIKNAGKARISNLSLEEIQPDPYADWNLELLQPPYRDTFFASDDKLSLRADIHAPGAFYYESELLDAQRNCLASRKGGIDANGRGKVEYAFNTPLPEGDYLLDIRVMDQHGQKDLSREIRVVPPAPVEIKRLPNKYFAVNGKPFFPIFYFYEMVDDDVLYQAARNGVNICIMGFNNANHALTELDRFHKYGIKGVIYLEQYGHINAGDRFEEFQKHLRERVDERVLAHPALFGYLLADEPFWKGIPATRIQQYAQEVKKHDPYHPIWINAAPRNEIEDHRPYAENADIYGVDIYPIPYPNGHPNLPNREPSCVGDYTRRFTEIVRGKKTVWMILQGNSWSDYAPAPDALSRWPTLAEERFMTFNAVLNGSHGYGLYSPEHNRGEQFQKDMFTVSREFHQLSGLFVNAQRLPDAKSSNPEISCALFQYADRRFGILMNKAVTTQQATVSLPDKMELTSIPAGRLFNTEQLELQPLEIIVFGEGPLPPPTWELPPADPAREDLDTFSKHIRIRQQKRLEAYRQAGKQPPESH